MKRQKLVLIRGFNVLIDESIAKHIQWLNENGFHTSKCCSGDLRDHNKLISYRSTWLEFPVKMLKKDKLDLLVATMKEVVEYLKTLPNKPGTKDHYVSYEINDYEFGIEENNIHYTKFLDFSSNYPEDLHLLMHVLKQTSKKEIL